MASRQVTNLALSLLSFAGFGRSAMGPAFSTGPVNSGNFVREATSTLMVPDSPNPVVGNTVLWVGMGTSNGDLIQAINNNYPPDYSWCVAAYTIDSGSGPHGTSGAGDLVTMHYKYNDATGLYDQDVSINGAVVSTISSNSGLALGWGTSVECTTKPCGNVASHTWIDTVITLNEAYPGYIQTNGKGEGVTGNMTTTDGGKTWTVTPINIPAWDCTTL